MSREASGELERLRDGRFAARVTIEGRKRRQLVLVAGLSEADAEARTRSLAKMAAQMRKAGLVNDVEDVLRRAALQRPGKPWEAACAGVTILCSQGAEAAREEVVPTFADFADEWTSGRLRAKYPDHVGEKDSSDDKSRIRRYFAERLGPMRLDTITLADCDAVMADLPDELEAWTRRHIAQALRRVMALAVYPGRHIAASPVPRGWLPKPGKPKARSCVYPGEDARMMAHEAIPLWRRLLWGFMAREGTRGPSEALSLRWRHVNLERGAVRLDTNKTDDPRVWALAPGTARALRAWKKMTTRGTEPNDLVFVDEYGRTPDTTRLAAVLRDDLRAALGDDARPELFEDGKHRIHLRAHDLRGSFVTVALANGKSETWVTDRTGHTTSGQLLNYRRAARTIAELEIGEWTPLDEALPELRPLPTDCPSPGPTGADSGQVGITIEPDSRIAALVAENSASLGAAAARREGSSPSPRTGQSAGNERHADPVERALADALTRASAAGEWSVVGQLARELEARRAARAPNVVDFPTTARRNPPR